MHETLNQRDRLAEPLRALFKGARLPSSPAIARRILRLIEDPHSAADQFAQVIEADPALAARLMRLANSVYYAQRTPVTTIQRAVTVVGLGQLRVLALGFELVSRIDHLGSCAFDLRSFWQQAVLRACLARQVALRVVPERAEEALLVGLLQDCGIVVLVQGLGREYADLYRAHAHCPQEFYHAERRHGAYTHVDAIEAMAGAWNFPESLVRPLANHHRQPRLGGRSPQSARLEAVGYFVGAFPFTADDGQTRLPPAVASYAREDLGLDGEGLEACFAASRAAYHQMAPLLDPESADNLDVTELLVVANQHLQRQAADVESRVRAVEAERDRVLDEQVTLKTALGQYREQAARDPLTGLRNRRALIDAGDACVQALAARQGQVAVFFLDLDDFKAINDSFGHMVGDVVLRAVARCADEIAGAEGVCGRYGGEEFVLVLPDAGEVEARARGEQLLERVRAIRLDGIDLKRPVTCSLGAVVCRLGGGGPASGATHAPPAPPVPPVQSLMTEADQLMYAAKRAGKDCMRLGVARHGMMGG